MSGVFYIFSAITAVFFVLLIAKELFAKKTRLCLVCVSVSLTWIALLALYKKGIFDDVVILSLLMGQSIVGIFYLMEKRVKEELHIFKVPFLLTLTFAFYSAIAFPDDFLRVLSLLAGLWLVLGVLFFYRSNRKAGAFIKKLIECCKRW